MKSQIRFGLCCLFREKQIKFRTSTASSLGKLNRDAQLVKLSTICLNNVQSLKRALETVDQLGIKAFRILSPLFPVYTHPDCAYHLDELPDNCEIRKTMREINDFRENNDIRLSFHPDQFIVLNSPKSQVVASAVAELEYQTMLAELTGAELINLHLGGVYGDKNAAIRRFIANFAKLPEKIRLRLSLENDDVSYSPSDLVPVSENTGIPLVYDVHHHRCNSDNLSIAEASERCAQTWIRLEREPYFHISSPKNGWQGSNPKPHSDFIDCADFPDEWRQLSYPFTLDVEAKAKELAVIKLMQDIA